MFISGMFAVLRSFPIRGTRFVMYSKVAICLDGGKDVSKLPLAPKELTKTASSHVETTSLALSRDAGIEKDTTKVDESKLESLEKSLSSLEKNVSEIRTQIITMNAQISTVNQSIELQTKRQSLYFAYANADIGSFEYVDKNAKGCFQSARNDSAELVRSILLSFRRGNGMSIDGLCVYEYSYERIDCDPEGVMFRVAIACQLEELLVTTPRVVSQDGKWMIYYE